MGLMPVRGQRFLPYPKYLGKLFVNLAFYSVGTTCKLPGYQVDHSSTPSAEIKNERGNTSPLPVCLHIMDSDNFTHLNITAFLMQCTI